MPTPYLFVKIIVIIILFAILSVLYYHIFILFPKDSDDANAMLIGQNLFNGNLNLSGWWIAPDNFITSDEIVYGTLLKIFGFRPAILAAVPAVLWAFLLLISGWLSIKRREYDSIWRFLPIIILLGLPVLQDNAALSAITQSPAHIGTMCYVIGIFLVANTSLKHKEVYWRYIILLFSLTVLAITGDPLADFVGALPVLIGVIFTSEGITKVRCVMFFTVLLGVLIGYGITRINTIFGGFTARGIPMTFASASEFPKNFSLTIQSILMIFGADILGLQLKDSFIEILRLIMVTYIFIITATMSRNIVAVFFGKEYKRDKMNFIDIALVAGIIINILSSLFSTELIDIYSGRYFIPTLVFGAILLSRQSELTRPIKLLYIIIMMLSGISLIHDFDSAKPVIVSPEIASLSRKIEKLSLHHGYGPYWASSIITVWTKEHVRVRALVQTGNKQLIPYRWQADRSWYPQQLALTKPFFVISMLGPNSPVSQESVIKTFGKPCFSKLTDDYQINIYRACTK